MSRDSLKEKVFASIRREPSPTRPQLRRRQLAGILASVAMALLVFFMAGGVRVTIRPLLLVILTSALALLIASATTWLALGRGRSMVGRSSILLVAAAVLAPALLLGSKLYVSAQFAGMSVAWPGRLGLKCLLLGVSASASLAMAFLYNRRHSSLMHPRLIGMALGAAAGAWAWMLIDLWCPVAYLPHVLLGHLLPLLLIESAGVLFGGRWLELPRAASRRN